MRTIAAALAALAVLFAAAVGAAEERRVALVIGNGAYAGVGQLANPPTDARRMAEMLRRDLGFVVVEPLVDGKLADIDAALDRFDKTSKGADIALFYFSGLGMEMNGHTWLVPVDARLEQERDVQRQAVELAAVLQAMHGARVKLVLLDSCRNNPFAGDRHRAGGERRDFSGPRAPYDAEDGTVIAFATAPGGTAIEGDGPDSPFTTALLRFLPSQTEDIRVVLSDVSNAVREVTGGTQIPWIFDSLQGRLILGLPRPTSRIPAQE